MRIEQATAFLYALKPRGIRFGLENTRLVLERLGDPQKHFQVIHLAGSNGKGSTAAFLEAVLRQAGFRVGLYTSPHLNHFRERFRVDGVAVGDEAIGSMLDRLLSKGLGVDPEEVAGWVERDDLVTKMDTRTWYQQRGGADRYCRLTFFECTTVLAVLLFAEAGVDLALMECGMGGRLDATNVFLPMVSVITSISLEHTEWLGTTITAIAGEKAGIIKEGVPVVCARQVEEARRVIEREAASRRAPLSMMGKDFDGYGGFRQASFRVRDRSYGPVSLGLSGNHQVINAATALGCLPHLEAGGFPVDPRAVLKGLELVDWAARFERFGPAGEWVLDGAHNPDGVRVLVEAVGDVFGERKLRLVFGVLQDKDADRMLDQLDRIASQVELVRPVDARGRDPGSLVSLVSRPATVHSSVASALEKLMGLTGPPVLVTGSLTVVGEARAWLLEHGFFPMEPKASTGSLPGVN